MSTVSNIKNLFALVAVHFLLTICSESGERANFSDTNTNHYRIISENIDGKRVVSEDRIFRTADEYITMAPDGATVITGLKAGNTVAVATNNTNVLNAALDGGNKNLIIPSGTWYTGHTVYVRENTTLTFEGKLHQLDTAADWKDWSVIRIDSPNVTLNNPYLSQKGRLGGHGTHACLQIYGKYNTGNIIINGGILEWGASNNFHGGRNNTVFNGTIFRDSMEHLIYAHGLRGDGIGSGRASGLTFNDCIFERPGNGLYKEIEANHIQIRQYKNVEINNCIVKGKKKTLLNQFGILVTTVDGLVVNDTSFSDYTQGLLYTGWDTHGVVFNRVTASGQGNNHIRKSDGTGGDVIFNDCTFNRPYGVAGDSTFNSCTFRPTGYYMKSVKGAKITFDSCTWDYSNLTYSKAFVKEVGSTVVFTGTQTKIAPSDGHSFAWGPLSAVD